MATSTDITHRRKPVTIGVVDSIDYLRLQPVQHDEAVHAELRRCMASIIRKMPIRQRRCILMHFWLDMPTRVIAQRLGVRQGSIIVCINKGLRSLRHPMRSRPLRNFIGSGYPGFIPHAACSAAGCSECKYGWVLVED